MLFPVRTEPCRFHAAIPLGRIVDPYGGGIPLPGVCYLLAVVPADPPVPALEVFSVTGLDCGLWPEHFAWRVWCCFSGSTRQQGCVISYISCGDTACVGLDTRSISAWLRDGDYLFHGGGPCLLGIWEKQGWEVNP